jgi:hypothetical protein
MASSSGVRERCRGGGGDIWARRRIWTRVKGKGIPGRGANESLGLVVGIFCHLHAKPSPLFYALLSLLCSSAFLVSVTCGQPQSENIKRKISEINNS